MGDNEKYMDRCIQLARLAAGNVAPNPMVGALLVHEGRVIGEGFHEKYGDPHAEVNCIDSVLQNDIPLIEKSKMYVSLEPCTHFGKTPPCVDLILNKRIPEVIIGSLDPFVEVGKGAEKMRKSGVRVTTGVMEAECRELNRRFFTFHEKQRPYIILKWAQSLNGKIGSGTSDRIHISNEYTNSLVHKWRSEEAGILIGTNTALYDNPALTTRLWEGNNPVRIVIDSKLRLPVSLQVFDKKARTIIFNFIKQEEFGNLLYYKLQGNLLPALITALFELNILSIIVEGGSELLQSFIDLDLWDEARVISNLQLTINGGVVAPQFKNSKLVKQESETGDLISYYVKER